jgi:hypothetical protein
LMPRPSAVAVAIDSADAPGALPLGMVGKSWSIDVISALVRCGVLVPPLPQPVTNAASVNHSANAIATRRKCHSVDFPQQDWSSIATLGCLHCTLARNKIAIPMCTVFQRALLCRVVDVHQTKALGITGIPFVVIEQTPIEKSSHVDA